MATSKEIGETANTALSNSNQNEAPPPLSISVKKLEDIDPPSQKWRDVRIPVDVVLLTVKEYEFLNCYYYLEDVVKSYHNDLSWVYFGDMGKSGEKAKVALVRCFQGGTGPGGSQSVVENAVRILKPKAVICVGYCGALNLSKTKLGDVVISAQLATYSNCKTTSSGVERRGVIANVGKLMRNLIMCAGHGWKAPLLDNQAIVKPKVHSMAEILTGPELVVDARRREELVKQFPNSIAIEMEGEGVYAACHNLGVQWVVIKGISDYADENKRFTENWKPFASAMSASVVNHILSDPEVLANWPNFGETNTSESRERVSDGAAPQHATSNDQNLILRLVKEMLVGDSGQLPYKGRMISYKSCGRVHSLYPSSEWWVYDGEAQDNESGISVTKSHFYKSEDANKAAIAALIQKLHDEGIIQN